MSSYLNIKLSQFKLEGKFKYPGENINQSDYRNYGSTEKGNQLTKP